MDTKIADKTALVCGASAGIGLASARALAAEGAHVVLLARTREELERRVDEIRAAGGRASFVAGDLSRTAGLPELARQAGEATGRIDILVNNSGGPPSGDPLSFDAEAWEQAFRATFLSAETLTRLLLPAMAARGWGRVINLESVSVLRPIEGLVLSNAVRMAVVGWTRTLARAVAARGVTVNTVATGNTLTRRIEELARARAQKQGRTLEEALADTAASAPMGRLARPEEIASVVVFLAGEGASYVTGATIPVDGGYAIG